MARVTASGAVAPSGQETARRTAPSFACWASATSDASSIPAPTRNAGDASALGAPPAAAVAPVADVFVRSAATADFFFAFDAGGAATFTIGNASIDVWWPEPSRAVTFTG